MTLTSHKRHPHGMDQLAFEELFTESAPVVFAFHGYPRVVHELIYSRPKEQRFHVRGYMEEGTTTTPFDMVVLNEMSRFHLAIEALRRVSRLHSKAGSIIEMFEDKLTEHHHYIRDHFEDLPEIKDWTWSEEGIGEALQPVGAWEVGQTD